MTVLSEQNRSEHVGNGVTVEFPTEFTFSYTSDVRAFVAGIEKSQPSHFTVTGGSGSTGTVIFVTAPANMENVVLFCDPETTQKLGLTATGAIPSEALELSLDRVVMMSRRANELLKRSFRLPDADVGVSEDMVILPPSATRSNTIVSFDSAGNMSLLAAADLSQQTVSAFISTLLDDVDAESARTTLGIQQQSSNGADLDANSVGLQQLARGTAGKVLLGQGAGADNIWGDAPFNLSSIADGGLTRSKLAATVATKFKGFASHPVANDQTYAGVLLRLIDDSLLAWGRTGTLNLGLNETTDTIAVARKPVFNVAIPAGVTLKDVIQTICCSYALFTNGWVYACGTNAQGQLGQGDVVNRSVFTRIEFFVSNSITVDKVFAAGSRYDANHASAFFLNAAGNVWACGYNGVGQLGVGDLVNRTTPTPISGSISGVAEVVTVAANNASTYLRTNAGALYACGNNAQGQLGLGDLVNRSSFVSVTSFGTVATLKATARDTTVATAMGYVLALLTNGDVYACGHNAYGQLGLGDTSNRSGFTKLTALASITAIGAAGGDGGYAYAISNTGRLYTWGYNVQGAIGDGTTTNRLSPFNVVGWSGNTGQDPPFIGKILKLETGFSYGNNQGLVVLDTDGKLWFCGQDYGFFCGDTAINRPRFTPVLNFALDGATEKIITMQLHGTDNAYRLLLLSDDAKLYALGDNSYGICQAGYSATPAIVKSVQRVMI